MNRIWTDDCRQRDCDHLPSEHLATPELAADDREQVLWCVGCRRHEVLASRFTLVERFVRLWAGS